MKITLVAVGRGRGPLEGAVREFETRAARYWRLEVVEVDSGAGRGGSGPEAAVRRAEAERIRSRLPEGAQLWALTRGGSSLDSDAWARELDRLAVGGVRDLAILIGGAYGLDATLLDAAHRTLSLSPMTLPHAMARLVLAEQLYRAGSILRNEPYHKGGST